MHPNRLARWDERIAEGTASGLDDCERVLSSRCRAVRLHEIIRGPGYYRTAWPFTITGTAWEGGANVQPHAPVGLQPLLSRLLDRSGGREERMQGGRRQGCLAGRGKMPIYIVQMAKGQT